ncbi:MAG: hypothetical protein OXL96_08185 [Candidatus Poribacteria bacterium]|nr:hypothetical protein [Candidatus Poribacteria bacterium]
MKKKRRLWFHFREFLWPCLEREDQEKISKRKEHLKNIVDGIETVRWRSLDTVLEEIRRLTAREDERRKTAETKATIYLAVLAAIVPLSASFVEDLVKFLEPSDDWQFFVLVFISLLAIAYLLAAGVWTFRTIEVSGYHRVEVEDLFRLGIEREIKLALSRKILATVMKNRAVVNRKVTNLRMAHAFIIRLFVSIVLISSFPLILTVVNRISSWCAVCYGST